MVDPRRTLCARCVRDYITAGFFVAPLQDAKIKEPCDICRRPGFEYVVGRTRQRKGTGLNGQN